MFQDGLVNHQPAMFDSRRAVLLWESEVRSRDEVDMNRRSF